MSKEKTGGDPPSDEGARSFSLFISQFAEGALHAELSETLRDVVKQLEAHAEDFGKAAGVITLKLAVGIEREAGMVIIKPEVTTKMPKPLRKNAVYWVNPAGNLVPENPRQQKLPLAAVPQAMTRAVPAAAPGPERSAPPTP